ncbi:MAG: hypothetical protein QXD02_03980 [Candidatus Parvarchaeum sp.]|nr:hypothetical protein [Candidatus Parvarchaeum tengchongense]
MVLMNNLTTKIARIFNDSLEAITNDSNHTSHSLISDNLLTRINCNYRPCSDSLTKLSSIFNASLKASQNSNNVIKAFITENKDTFQKIESMFQHSGWSTNDRIREFNVATHDTSSSRCTIDNKFYIIKCYDYFYYIYNTESNHCLIVTTGEKKSLTMVNILLLTPYLLYGDLYAVHGGLVNDGENNILLTSSSLGGKTTFALLFLENGGQILTEETTYITKYGELLNYNVRNYFNIRIGTYLEFKDFFIKAGIINDSFLTLTNLTNMTKEKLFELGKKEQISIDFETLCKKRNNIATNRITHALKITLKKDKTDMTIKKSNSNEIVDRFLEVSLAPTVLLFKKLTNMTDIKRSKRRQELIQIFRNVKNYSITSGLDYKRNFNFLLNEIRVLSKKNYNEPNF